MKYLSKQEFLDLLQDRVSQAGGQKALAERMKVSPTAINLTLHDRRAPSPKLLRQLGLREHQPEPVYTLDDEEKED